MFGIPKRDVVTTTHLGLGVKGVSICGHVYPPMLQNEKRTEAAYWALVESYRTATGPRQRVVAWLGSLTKPDDWVSSRPLIRLINLSSRPMRLTKRGSAANLAECFWNCPTSARWTSCCRLAAVWRSAPAVSQNPLTTNKSCWKNSASNCPRK